MRILNTALDPAGHVVGFSAIAPETAEQFWPTIAHHAEAALQYAFDDAHPDQILKAIVDDRIVLVVITVDAEIKASLTLEMHDVPRGRVCHLATLGGGDMADWVEAWVDVWVAIAREQGADWLTLKGRKGWERVSKRYGFTHEYTQMQRYIGTPP